MKQGDMSLWSFPVTKFLLLHKMEKIGKRKKKWKRKAKDEICWTEKYFSLLNQDKHILQEHPGQDSQQQLQLI